MKDYICDFCWEFGYPTEARKALTDCYDTLQALSPAKLLMDQLLLDYKKEGRTFACNDGLRRLREAFDGTDVNVHTLELLYYILLSKNLRKMYVIAGIPYDIFFDSLCDLKWKLFECHRMYGDWGSFVAPWFAGFFTLDRFAFGRLQLELSVWNSDTPYECEGRSFPKGSPCINMHIPSCGPLSYEACMDSFRRAYRFYRDMFDSEKILFACNSWLLYDKHRSFLPQKSNIRMFMDFFDIRDSHESPQFGDCWRIFYKKYTGSVEGFPRETSLQRAYYDWVASGHQPGCARGAFLFDGEKLYHHDK